MDTTLSARPGRHDHPPQPASAPASPTLAAESSARRVGLIDRLALHLGVALVTWSNRPRPTHARRRTAPTHESIALYREQQLARAERERELERALLFIVLDWRA